MKIQYNFLKDLKELLTSVNWGQKLQERLESIEKELEVTPEIALQHLISARNSAPKLIKFLKNESSQKAETDFKIKHLTSEQRIKYDTKHHSKHKANLTKRIDKLKEKGPNLISAEDAQIFKNNYQKKLDLLLKEKEQLIECIENGSYKLGVAPFDKIENNKLLLANEHVLELKLPSMPFNVKAVEAVKKMLTTNFDLLYDQNVKNITHNETIYRPQNTKAPTEEYSHINKDVLLYSHNTMHFINQFFINQHNCKLFDLVEQLAFNFNKISDVDRFLEQDVNFASGLSMTNSIMTHKDIPLCLSRTSNELAIFKEINSKYLKKGINTFKYAAELNFNNPDLYEEIVTSKDTEEIYKKINEWHDSIPPKKYTNEEKCNKVFVNLAHKYNIPSGNFDIAIKEILPKQKTNDLLPDISFKINSHKEEFTFSKLKPGDFQGLFLGKMTACCQSLDDHGRQCAIDGFTREDAGFYIITDSKNNIVAQSYAWLGQNNNNQDVLVLDSFECQQITKYKDLLNLLLKDLTMHVIKEGFSELHIGIGEHTPALPYQCIDKAVHPKNQDLTQYLDSSKTYAFTDKTSFNEVREHISSIEYKDFNSFYNQNILVKWDKMVQKKGLQNSEILWNKIKEIKPQILNHIILEEKIPVLDFLELLAENPSLTRCALLNKHSTCFDLPKQIELVKAIFSHPLEKITSIMSYFNEIHSDVLNNTEISLLMDLFETKDVSIASNKVGNVINDLNLTLDEYYSVIISGGDESTSNLGDIYQDQIN